MKKSITTYREEIKNKFTELLTERLKNDNDFANEFAFSLEGGQCLNECGCNAAFIMSDDEEKISGYIDDAMENLEEEDIDEEEMQKLNLQITYLRGTHELDSAYNVLTDFLFDNDLDYEMPHMIDEYCELLDYMGVYECVDYAIDSFYNEDSFKLFIEGQNWMCGPTTYDFEVTYDDLLEWKREYDSNANKNVA